MSESERTRKKRSIANIFHWVVQNLNKCLRRATETIRFDRLEQKKRNATAQDHLDWSWEIDRELSFEILSRQSSIYSLKKMRCLHLQSQSNLKLSTLRKVKLSSSLLVLTVKLPGNKNEAIGMKLTRIKSFFGFWSASVIWIFDCPVVVRQSTLSTNHRKRISRPSVRDNFASRESKTGELDVDRLCSIFREFPVNTLCLSWKKEKNTKDFGVWRKHETQILLFLLHE